ERDVGVAKAADAALVAEGLGEGFAQDEGRVFDRVVIVDVHVARRLHVEVDLAVTPDDVEHVREKADRRVDGRFAAVAVEVERDGDVRFIGLARERCGSGHDDPYWPLSWKPSFSAARNRSFCSREPIDTRK